MQPYFFPYSPYYRLLSEVDVFVVFDTAQFPRRGRVHRCQTTGPTGAIRWLTLPLQRAPRDASIEEMHLSGDFDTEMTTRIARAPRVAKTLQENPELRDLIIPGADDLCDYLWRQLEYMVHVLGTDTRLLRASRILPRNPEQDYQDYVIGIGHELGAIEYVNLPGGLDLYDHSRFASADLGLRFLTPTEGPGTSVLEDWPNAIQRVAGAGGDV